MKGWYQTDIPCWLDEHQYRIVKGTNHPDNKHNEIKAEWDSKKDSGNYTIQYGSKCGFYDWVTLDFFNGNFERDYEYRIVELVKLKPKLKLVDMSKLPTSLLTLSGTKISYFGNTFLVDTKGNVVAALPTRIKLDAGWQYWEGGECPMPHGVLFSISYRKGGTFSQGSSPLLKRMHWEHSGNNSDIIAYKITGIEEGYTDDESLV